MNKLNMVTIIAITLSAFVLPPAAQAQALGTLNPPSLQVKKKVVKQKTAGNNVKFLPGSQETTKERSTRLQRECRGGVNAGACAGYTR